MTKCKEEWLPAVNRGGGAEAPSVAEKCYTPAEQHQQNAKHTKYEKL